MKLIDHIDQEFSEGRSRKEFAAGVDHYIFTATDNSDVIYKLGPKIAVDYWFEDFKKYPKLFPKVYKRGRTSMKLKSEKIIRSPNGFRFIKPGTVLPLAYVILEKLDTDRVEREWMLLDKLCEDIREIDDYGFYDLIVNVIMNNTDETDTLKIFDSEMKNYGEKIYRMFRRYIDLIYKIKAIKPGVPDLHMGNFGYDKNGVLKCLDF